MQTAGIVFGQVTIMFILIAIGMILVRKDIITKQIASGISNLLMVLILPTMIINSFQREFKIEELHGFLVAFGVAVFFHIMAILITYLFIPKKNGDSERVAVQRMASIYSNCGFMAFPILQAVVGLDGIFYGSAFVAVFNIALWTNGVRLLVPGDKLSVRKAILNPGVISVLIGFGLYVFQVPLPYVVSESISMLASINTPFSMLITGVFLGRICWRKSLRDISLYKAGILRIVLLPLLLLGVVTWCKIAVISDTVQAAVICTVICSACPSAASTILMVARMGRDGEYGAELVAISTFFSIFTLPLVTFLTSYFIG